MVITAGDKWISQALTLAAKLPAYPVLSSPWSSQSLQHAPQHTQKEEENGGLACVSHFLLMLPS